MYYISSTFVYSLNFVTMSSLLYLRFKRMAVYGTESILLADYVKVYNVIVFTSGSDQLLQYGYY